MKRLWCLLFHSRYWVKYYPSNEPYTRYCLRCRRRWEHCD